MSLHHGNGWRRLSFISSPKNRSDSFTQDCGETLDQTNYSLSQPFSKPFRRAWSGNGWRRLFFISSPRNSSGGAAVLKSGARRHSRVRRRQIECHGEIAISTLNRKFALTSDVEPCLITRFKLRGRRKARLSKLTFKKNIAIFVQCNLRVLTKTCPNLSQLVQKRSKICINFLLLRRTSRLWPVNVSYGFCLKLPVKVKSSIFSFKKLVKCLIL